MSGSLSRSGHSHDRPVYRQLPNGFKITIALEELGLPYTLRHVHIDAGENRRPAFLRLNPHGRIPVLVDHATGITLFESAAILLYGRQDASVVADRPQARWQAIQWLMFHAASVGPIIGQRVHFEIFSATPQPEAIERYRGLCDAAFGVLDGSWRGIPMSRAKTIRLPISRTSAGPISPASSASISAPTPI